MPTEIDLQRLIELSPAVHYVSRASGDFSALYISERVHAQLGYLPAQFTEDPAFWADHIHPDDRARVFTELGAVFDRDGLVLEYRFLHADGNWRWMRDELVLVRGENGRADQIVGSWLDITARKCAEEAHRVALTRFEEAQRIAGIGSWEIDVASSEQWWSEETYRIMGEDPRVDGPRPEDLLNKIHPDDRGRFMAAVEQARLDGKPYSVDYRIVLADGTEKVIHGQGYAIANGGGPVVRFAGTVQDITQRDRTERALREAEARNRALLEANPDVIFRIDASGQYLDLSISAATPFPFTYDQIVGRNVRDFYSPEFVAEHQRHVRKAIETGETQLWDCRITLPHGDVDLEARFVRSGDREAVVTVRDVTERLALQREIVAAQERERSRIGHDLHDGLGQELTGISFSLGALAKKLAAEGSPHLNTVLTLKSMAQKSISVTRRIARSLSPGLDGGFGLTEALELLASEVSGHAGVSCNARCEHLSHRHSLEVETNLYRIAQESVTNALKHGLAKNIELRCRCDGRTIRLEVLDDGIGMSPERRGAEGMGRRGMRYRAQLVNGALDVGERPGGGTQIVCTCPCQLRAS